MGDDAHIHEITGATFESVLLEHEIIFIDFWATWCAPCKQFSVVYEQAAKLYPTIWFGQVNIEAEAELSDVFQIQSIPHLIVFKQGVAIYSESGSLPLSTLKELAEQALSVDVSAIKIQMDEGEENTI